MEVVHFWEISSILSLPLGSSFGHFEAGILTTGAQNTGVLKLGLQKTKPNKS